ncbi:hypothetical protein J2Z32_000619 [Paenibacillus turicensis]|uniref:Uncharacterized protein n=1 Tax=Paenibacillus turicensis TaxID=160487 RepID=A0ABS4FN45_9BACL|nr:hypothetical protein [Paenibacillus turicensis]
MKQNYLCYLFINKYLTKKQKFKKYFMNSKMEEKWMAMCIEKNYQLC